MCRAAGCVIAVTMGVDQVSNGLVGNCSQIFTQP
jgi:hypothetical protein